MSASERVASMSPDELIAAITAGLDADEQTARALDGATRMLGGKPDFTGQGGPAAETFWSHVTPSRVLADVESKRAILAEHYPVDPCDAHDAAFRTVACPTLIALARPYLDQEAA